MSAWMWRPRWSYKPLVTFHLIVSVGWVGISAIMLILGLIAATGPDPDTVAQTQGSMGLVTDTIFPVLPLAVLVTGVVLSLVTKWGLFRYYWIVVKIALTVAIVVQGAAVIGPGIAGGVSPERMVTAAAANLAMLVGATAISVYKPWGKIWSPKRNGRKK